MNFRGSGEDIFKGKLVLVVREVTYSMRLRISCGSDYYVALRYKETPKHENTFQNSKT